MSYEPVCECGHVEDEHDEETGACTAINEDDEFCECEEFLEAE